MGHMMIGGVSVFINCDPRLKQIVHKDQMKLKDNKFNPQLEEGWNSVPILYPLQKSKGLNLLKPLSLLVAGTGLEPVTFGL